MNRQFVVFTYLGWILSCVAFFVMGLSIGKLASSPFEQRHQVQTTRAETPASGQTNEEHLASNAAANAKYAVQVTVVSTAAEANQIVSELHRKGFTSAYITLPADSTGPQLYSVKVGFYNLPTANQVAEELQRDLGFRNARVVSN